MRYWTRCEDFCTFEQEAGGGVDGRALIGD